MINPASQKKLMKLLIYIFLFSNLLFIQSCADSPTQKTGPEVTSVNRAITVQGKATIRNGAKLLARKQAFKDAIRNAALEAGSQVSSETLLGSAKVVDEWVSANTYHVQVLAVLSDGKKCNSPYRKRLVATGFPSVTSGQISSNESQDLYSGIPREIMNILMEDGGLIGRNETHTILYSQPDMAPEIMDQSAYHESIVVQMAEKSGVQFVLSGVIRDLEFESTEYIRGSGVFARIKSWMSDFVARRGISIDVYIHDGMSGALLFQHRYTDSVIGDVWIPSGYTVGSERFKGTPAGHKISKIIQLASKDIGDLLACYPYSTKVINVENDKVYIASGAQDKLKPGDSLVVYAAQRGIGIQGYRLIGVINIQDIQANYAVGEMELTSDARKIRAGDLVKSW